MAALGDRAERLAAEIVDGSINGAAAGLPDLKRVVLAGHLVSVGQQPALDPLDQVRAAGRDVVRLPRLPDHVPQRLAELAALEVDLESALARIARTGDDLPRARHLDPAEFEEADVAYMRAEEIRQQRLGLRALHGERADVGLEHLRLHARAERQPLGVEQHVAVGDREPEPVLGQLQQHRIVDQPGALVDDGHVEAVADPGAAQIARRHPLHEAGGVGSADLDLALARDVPDLRMRAQVPVILLDAALIGLGQQHVVDDRVAAHAERFDAPGVGRAPDAARHVEPVGNLKSPAATPSRNGRWAR